MIWYLPDRTWQDLEQQDFSRTSRLGPEINPVQAGLGQQRRWGWNTSSRLTTGSRQVSVGSRKHQDTKKQGGNSCFVWKTVEKCSWQISASWANQRVYSGECLSIIHRHEHDCLNDKSHKQQANRQKWQRQTVYHTYRWYHYITHNRSKAVGSRSSGGCSSTPCSTGVDLI